MIYISIGQCIEDYQTIQNDPNGLTAEWIRGDPWLVNFLLGCVIRALFPALLNVSACA